jgi:uncharacterized cupredoxin-like copper-binding protein
LTYAPDESSAEMAMGSGGSASTEEVAALAVPDQTVPISVGNNFSFTPNQVTVKQGDTIAFVITNDGQLPHEFVIGSEAVQQEHEEEMLAGEEESMDEMGDKPYAVDVPAGETVTLVYTFDEAGQLLYGCHVQGHYTAGMVGTITIE